MEVVDGMSIENVCRVEEENNGRRRESTGFGMDEENNCSRRESTGFGMDEIDGLRIDNVCIMEEDNNGSRSEASYHLFYYLYQNL